MRNINIEIKSKFDNHDKIRNILKQQNADYIGIDFQTDTYFNVRNGSLKLREGNVENKLVYEEYELSEIKNVLLYHTQKNSTLKEILLKTYGIQEIIEKHREVYQINNVRFYIDYVSSLGNFIGIEAKGRNNSHTKDQLIEQCNYYINLFELTEWEYIENPYTGKVDQLTQDNNLHAA